MFVKINHKNNLDLIIENKQTSLLSGFAVKHLSDYDILGQITPSKYVTNDMKEHIVNLYNSDLPQHRKDIMNAVIGNTRYILGYESTRSELTTGYYFISLLIYDFSRIALKQLASSLIDSGYPI